MARPLALVTGTIPFLAVLQWGRDTYLAKPFFPAQKP